MLEGPMSLDRQTLDAAPSILRPVAALIGGILALSVGSSLAVRLFPLVGAEGTTALRAGFSALILAIVWRPWRRALTRPAATAILVYGVALGVMNLLFYMSLRTIPFGVAVAIEFAGPLGVATLSSRRAVDLLWVGCAVLGLSQLLPLGAGSARLDLVGLLYAAAAGVAWALYIVCGQRAGRLRGGDSVALGTAVAAVVVIPFGVARAGASLVSPGLLLLGFGVALLSSALPYSLEMYALRRLPRQTFGVLLSLEPAVSACAGAVLLGESLKATQWFAVAAIVAASAGSALTGTRR